MIRYDQHPVTISEGLHIPGTLVSLKHTFLLALTSDTNFQAHQQVLAEEAVRNCMVDQSPLDCQQQQGW